MMLNSTAALNYMNTNVVYSFFLNTDSILHKILLLSPKHT